MSSNNDDFAFDSGANYLKCIKQNTTQQLNVFYSEWTKLLDNNKSM